MCGLVCLTGKFAGACVHNEGPNSVWVPDSDNSSPHCSHNKLSCVTCSVLSYLFLSSVFLSVTVLLIIKRGDFLNFFYFPSFFSPLEVLDV